MHLGLWGNSVKKKYQRAETLHRSTNITHSLIVRGPSTFTLTYHTLNVRFQHNWPNRIFLGFKLLPYHFSHMLFFITKGW